MSKNEKTSENMNNYKCEYNKDCCISNKPVCNDEIYKSLCEMYEKDDGSNIFTTNGHNIIREVKRVAIYAIAAIALYMLFSVKKTVDNIENRVHNASSVTTK